MENCFHNNNFADKEKVPTRTPPLTQKRKWNPPKQNS